MIDVVLSNQMQTRGEKNAMDIKIQKHIMVPNDVLAREGRTKARLPSCSCRRDDKSTIISPF